MKLEYDKKTDILTMVFLDDPIVESDEKKDGIIIDYDKNDAVVSIEILDASEKMADPEKMVKKYTPSS